MIGGLLRTIRGVRPALAKALRFTRRRGELSYDAARDSTEYRAHWANADGLDADSANNPQVRQKLVRRSRYEAGSNGYYDGILDTHCNFVVGTGPTLRMLTGNRDFNKLVEREFWRWAQRAQLRRKLWAMAHARYMDGEAFAILQTNPAIGGDVQLDLMLLEAEQCQSPQLAMFSGGYIDGIKLDEFGNVEWYDILPAHPGSTTLSLRDMRPIQVPAAAVLHWFKLKRPGTHRGIPAMTSTLLTGASSRRWREATAAAAESAADFNVLLETDMQPSEEDERILPLETLPISKRMMTTVPYGFKASQMRAEFPTSNYGDFHRCQTAEQARPIGMPYNLAAADSSTYSFASGKLDTLGYRATVDVERQDGDDLVLDRVFAAWFKEWTIQADRRDIPPDHQWDWPSHPVIDAVAEANAEDIRLKNGTRTLRQAFSDAGMDLEDQLVVMAEDYFGDATEENVNEMRRILLRTHYPTAAVEPGAEQPPPIDPQLIAAQRQIRMLETRLSRIESEQGALV